MTSWIVTGLVFLSASALGAVAATIIFARHWRLVGTRKRRLDEVRPGQEVAQMPAQRLLKDTSLSTIPLLDRILSKAPRLSSLQMLLHQAGDPCNPGTLILVMGVILMLSLLAVSLHGATPLTMGLSALCLVGPVKWLRVLRQRRLGAFEEQFPEAVELIARALRAGHGLSSALKMVADEMENPIAEEFNRTFADYTYGKTLEEALVGMVERVGLKDLKFFATAVIMQRETGGNLTEILDNISHIIRERFRLQRQVKALSAEGRLSGVILTLMPPALLLVLWFTTPSYLQILFEHPLGTKLLWAGGGFQLMGIMVIKRLVRLEV